MPGSWPLPGQWLHDPDTCSECQRTKDRHTPPPALQELFDPLGYDVVDARPADPSGLVGRGLIALAYHPGGPWATWYVADGPVAGHYFDTEASAREDFKTRR